jgi:hypothetical protein
MEYRFRPITRNCASTGQPLVPGTKCYSVLVERNGTQERLDFSEAGWTGLPDEAVGFWRSVVPGQSDSSGRVHDTEALFKTLEQLVESPNPAQAKLCYVLALTLLQKKRLHLDGTTTHDDKVFLELSGSQGEGPFLVADQQLSESQITELRGALDQFVSVNWEAA